MGSISAKPTLAAGISGLRLRLLSPARIGPHFRRGLIWWGGLISRHSAAFWRGAILLDALTCRAALPWLAGARCPGGHHCRHAAI